MKVSYLGEKDPEAIKKFLEPLLQCLEVSVVVADDLANYKHVAADMPLGKAYGA